MILGRVSKEFFPVYQRKEEHLDEDSPKRKKMRLVIF